MAFRLLGAEEPPKNDDERENPQVNVRSPPLIWVLPGREGEGAAATSVPGARPATGASDGDGEEGEREAGGRGADTVPNGGKFTSSKFLINVKIPPILLTYSHWLDFFLVPYLCCCNNVGHNLHGAFVPSVHELGRREEKPFQSAILFQTDLEKLQGHKRSSRMHLKHKIQHHTKDLFRH